MEQERNRQKKHIFLKSNRCYEAEQEKMEASLFDYMQAHPELIPDPPLAPPDEFQKIMEEMYKRGKKIRIHEQIKKRNYARNMIYFLQKPFILFMVTGILLAAASMSMVSQRPPARRGTEAKAGHGLLLPWPENYKDTKDSILICYFDKVLSHSSSLKPMRITLSPIISGRFTSIPSVERSLI